MSDLSPRDIVKNLIAAGYTQGQLESLTGVSQSSISRILTGTHTYPRHSTVRALYRCWLKYLSEQKA